jgi:hypothetical protein
MRDGEENFHDAATMDERGAILAVATDLPERGLTGRPSSCCRRQLRPSAKQLVMPSNW